MSDVIQAMNMMGLTPYVLGTIGAFVAIAIFFAFFHKA